MKKNKLLSLGMLIPIMNFAQLPMGDRTIGFSATNSQSDVTYDSAFVYSLNVCAKTNYQIIKWGEVETSSGTFDSNKLNDLDGLDSGLPALGLQIDLTITTYDIVNKTLPSDLSSLPFDSPVLIARFQSFIDTVMNHLNTVTIHSLNVGNESDAAMGDTTLLINQYKTFYEAAASYMHSNYPEINVGTVITFNGLTNSTTKALYKTLNDSSDIIACNYYNVNDTFFVKPPANVITDMNTLVAEYPSDIIYFTEFGYPSSSSLNSSTSMQSQFITDMFTAWDNNYNNIKHISYFSITEWNHSTAVLLAQSIGLDSTDNYVPFLETLGLRTWQGWGANKTAYNTFLNEVQVRGACNPSAIDEVAQQNNLLVYPNPASDEVIIAVPDSKRNTITKIYDFKGRLIFTNSDKYHDNILHISTSQWSKGLYIIHVISGINSYESKINIIR